MLNLKSPRLGRSNQGEAIHTAVDQLSVKALLFLTQGARVLVGECYGVTEWQDFCRWHHGMQVTPRGVLSAPLQRGPPIGVPLDGFVCLPHVLEDFWLFSGVSPGLLMFQISKLWPQGSPTICRGIGQDSSFC